MDTIKLERAHLIGPLINNETIANPKECCRLVEAHAKTTTSIQNEQHKWLNCPQELQQLNWWSASSESLHIGENQDDSKSAPNCAQFNGQCSCPTLDVEQLRQIKLALLSQKNCSDYYNVSTDQANTSGRCKDIGQFMTSMMPNKHEQMREFNCKLTRKKLVKLELTRRLKKSSAQVNLRSSLELAAMYELERLEFEANQWLALGLNEQTIDDLLKIALFIEDSQTIEDPLELFPVSMGGLPIGNKRTGWRSTKTGSAAKLLASRSDSDDSGVSFLDAASEFVCAGSLESSSKLAASDLTAQLPSRLAETRQFHPLERLLRFRSSLQFELIIGYSCDLFAKTIAQSPLIKFDLSQERRAQYRQSSLHQLKLFACVECQKFRAMLRFEWLAHCLWLAIDCNGNVCGESIEKTNTAPWRRSRNDPMRRQPSMILGEWRHLDKKAESDYFEALARLMGHLLRQHFLEAALDSMLAAIERLLKSSFESLPPSLLISAELIERTSPTNSAVRLVDSSKPSEALRATLESVVEELAYVCSNLPRLEYQQADYELNTELKSSKYFIQVLWHQIEDDLLARKKLILAQLIDSARPVGQPDWINLDYLQTISLVNKFRTNELEDIGDLLNDMQPESLEQEQHNNADLNWRVHDHLAICRQVKLLDNLEFRLKCQLERYFDFGSLVRLDLGPLARQLELVVEQERSLLIRVHSDDLFKLIESLRLQLEELELNIDLESSFEDYLNRRWQIKQSQAPDLREQILLDDDQNVDDELGVIDKERRLAELMLSAESPELNNQVGAFDEAHEARQVKDLENYTNKTLEINQDNNDQDDELANALVSNNNPNVAQLIALSDPNNAPLSDTMAKGSELGVGARGIAPLVETRLLLGCYKYLSSFFDNDYSQFAANSEFSLAYGLTFLTEHHLVNPSIYELTQMDTSQLRLIGELVIQTREFSLMLKESLKRLDQARYKLHQAHNLRSYVLNKVCLEFDLLMKQLSSRQLNELRGAEDVEEQARNTIKHLDLIQETAGWAHNLANRLEFLKCQNDLLEREARHLDGCNQFDQFELPLCLSREANLFIKTQDSSSVELRANLLDKWTQLNQFEARFWRLAEEFETQQVKWLNSESKKLDYVKIKSIFKLNYSLKLDELFNELDNIRRFGEEQQMQSGANLSDYLNIAKINLVELSSNFNQFELDFLPIFKFLANKHLTSEHWLKLNRLLSGSIDSAASFGKLETSGELQLPSLKRSDQFCTTVAQLVELNAHKFVNQLDEISRRATVEHELSLLIELETRHLDELANNNKQSIKSQLKSLDICARLDDWAEDELARAASRFIRSKLEHCPTGQELIASGQESVQVDKLARQLVACHSAVKRYLRLSGQLNLFSAAESEERLRRNCWARRKQDGTSARKIVLRSNALLSTAQQVRASMLIELLRLFTCTWLKSNALLTERLARVRLKLSSAEAHLRDIDELQLGVRRVDEIELKAASRESELSLSRLQRNSMELELRREILASRESSALEKQRLAIGARDECVRQISERAIPAIRAATQALDCLGDGRSLRLLRSYRPRPPLAIRLVIEATCLLRNVCCSQSHFDHRASSRASRLTNTSTPAAAAKGPSSQASFSTNPERHFDALKGQIVEDYWPVAWRTLNGLHSSKLIQDLRLVSKRTIPSDVMRMVRRKYLSRGEFKLATIERISPETGLLARWLVAVDVFDRVLNIVRPSYEAYLRSEESLNDLMEDVTRKRRQVNSIGQQLELIQEQIRQQVTQRAKLIELANECERHSRQLELTKGELMETFGELGKDLAKIESKLCKLAQKCLWKSAHLVYVDALRADEQRPIKQILRSSIKSIERERSNQCRREQRGLAHQ